MNQVEYNNIRSQIQDEIYQEAVQAYALLQHPNYNAFGVNFQALKPYYKKVDGANKTLEIITEKFSLIHSPLEFGLDLKEEDFKTFISEGLKAYIKNKR
jgi:hypothetical protein